MRKTLTIIAGLSLLFASCSKSGGGGGGGGTTSTKTIHYVKMTHKGRTVYVTDSTRPTVPGVTNRPLMIQGFFTPLPYAKLSISINTPEIVLDTQGDRTGATDYLGDYIVVGVPNEAFFFRYSYWDAGVNYSGSIGQNDDNESLIKVLSFDDSTINGTAHLYLKDSSFMDLEFKVKNAGY